MKKVFFVIISLTLFAACSTKKAGITNRTYHRITSWYNTIFNGDQTMQQNLAEKKASYKDNYSTILKVEPIDPFENDSLETDVNDEDGFGRIGTLPRRTSSNQPAYAGVNNNNNRNRTVDKLLNASGFGNDNTNNTAPQSDGLERVIEKGNKAIDNHSMLINDKEYNSMLAEAYLLLGKANYYSQKPFDALNYLTYMNKTLVKNRLQNEAKNYIALANAQAGNIFEADQIFEELKTTKLKKRDRKLVSKSYAQFLIDRKRYPDAVEALEAAKKHNKTRYDRGRYSFIQGQLYEKSGDEDHAREYYQAAYKKKPSSELEIKSQIALANLFKGDSADYRNQIHFLKGLTKKGLYQSRKNELYYAMAVTALKSNREKEAMNFLKESLKGQESDPQIRGMAYKSIGDIYFSKPDYIYAGAYYDSALIHLIDPSIKAKLISKNSNLKEITEKYFLIKKNDSILALTRMSFDEKNQYFQKYIDSLKIKEEKMRKELENSQSRKNTTTFATETLDESINSTATATKGKWYFYDTGQKQKGMADFKRLWGSRGLADNWRLSKMGGSSVDDQRNQLMGTASAQDPRRFDVDFYTEKIPTDFEEINVLKQQRDTAELALGIAYYDHFSDLKSATSTLDHLLSTPPADKDVEIKALYNLFRFNRKADPVVAQKYGNVLTSKYPNSKYAEYVLNPSEDIFKSKSSEALTFYEEAYKKYEDGSYEEVKTMSQEALTRFPTDELIAKFSLLSAFCDAKQGNKQAFLEGLERVSVAFEEKPEGQKAAEWLEYFKNEEKEETATQTQQPEQVQQKTPQPEQVPQSLDEEWENLPSKPENEDNNPEKVEVPENSDSMLNPKATEILRRNMKKDN
ncbi:MAG: hypothetical protein LBT29_03830 [Flavobacteriaceae bacterium]|nr:hypothetical protein [Flavobacteriaceae bacterium]